MKYTISFLSCILLVGFTISKAQVIIARADVEYSHLPVEQQDDLTDLGMKVEQYFNNYNWIEDEFEYDLPTNIKIIIETVKEKTFEKIYRAQFLISTASGENFYDKMWEFVYDQSMSINHIKGQFDPLTHFLDFYAYMVLAGELDTNGLLLGNSLYEKARDIANQGILSNYSTGWSQRLDKLNSITNVHIRPLREAKPDFFEALYWMEEGNDKKAYEFAKKVLNAIAKVKKSQPNNEYMTTFFKSHYNELAKLFSGKNEELEMLVNFDSKHRATYRDHMN
ncbi:MAG: DUF4835 family protein [Caldithrix sp.]|nr:DUF4835 family protein [Caldithrix sp.]